jgi:hypothetical protein
LKKQRRSDKVALVDCNTRLIGPLFSKLAHAFASPRSMFVPPHVPPVGEAFVLSADDLLALEQIVLEWTPSRLDATRNPNEIIYIALRRLQWEMDSGRKEEVIEELRREIDYRLWCARNA